MLINTVSSLLQYIGVCQPEDWFGRLLICKTGFTGRRAYDSIFALFIKNNYCFKITFAVLVQFGLYIRVYSSLKLKNTGLNKKLVSHFKKF